MSFLQRFEEKFLPEPMSGCWLWEASLLNDGYGVFWMNGRQWRAHRAAWEIYHGPIPDGMLVLHRCDTPPCVNPHHLFLGTNLENMQDKMKKGRAVFSYGKNNKLRPEQVLQIYSDKRKGFVVASDYGVSQATISQIRSGNLWSWLTRYQN